MKRKIFLVALILPMLCLTAFPFIIRSENPKVHPDELGWKPSGRCRGSYFPIEAYMFEFQDTTFKVCPEFMGGRIVTAGPPLLAIIPNPILVPKHFREKFFFDIEVKGLSSGTFADFSNVWIQVSKEKRLQPAEVKAKVSGERRSYRLSFDVSMLEVKELIIEFGTIQVNGEKIYLPPFRYIRNTTYRYLPFVFPAD